jgi:hypothetical protein
MKKVFAFLALLMLAPLAAAAGDDSKGVKYEELANPQPTAMAARIAITWSPN